MGAEGAPLTNVLMRLPSSSCAQYEPAHARWSSEAVSVSRALKRRCALPVLGFSCPVTSDINYSISGVKLLLLIMIIIIIIF